MKRIVLVHGKFFNSWEALGLAYIAAYVKEHVPGIEDIKFFQGCFDDETDVIEAAARADGVFFSCTSPSFSYCRTLAGSIKKMNPSVHTVIGGYHPSALPLECLGDGIDQVVIGEGEAATVQIIKGLRDPVIQGRRMDFEELPFPDRDLIRNERNIEIAYKENSLRITSFQSIRACPFKCKYCSDGHEQVMYGGDRGRIVVRPTEDLLDEIECVVDKFNLDYIKFCDATWNVNRATIRNFCQRKIERRIGVPFFANIHANIADAEMFLLMKQAGCVSVGMGVESGSPKVLKQIGKGTTVEAVRRTVKYAKDAGVHVRGYFILGMPDETEDDLRMTEELADELDLDEYGFTILCPYPGSEIYSRYREELQHVDWSKTDEYHNDFWSTEHISNDRLLEWQRKLVGKFNRKITWHNRQTESGGLNNG